MDFGVYVSPIRRYTFRFFENSNKKIERPFFFNSIADASGSFLHRDLGKVVTWMTWIIFSMLFASLSTPPSTTTRPVPLCSASFITSFVWLPFLASCARKTKPKNKWAGCLAVRYPKKHALQQQATTAILATTILAFSLNSYILGGPADVGFTCPCT